MTRPFLSIAAVLGALLPAALPAPAQEAARPSFWSHFTVESVATGLMRSALGWARFLADIRYDQISVDPLAMRVVLTGVEIAPLIPSRPADACRIAADRITVNGAPLDRGGIRRTRVAADSLAVASGCLAPEAATMLRAMGFPVLEAPWVELDIRYDLASGGAGLRLSGDLERLAALDLSAEMEYVSVRMDYVREEPVFAVDLDRFEMTVRDKGGWALARNFLPRELTAPGALGPVVREAVAAMLADANGVGTPLGAEQRAFAAAAGDLAGGFAEGEQVVIATRIETPPLRLSEASVTPFAPLFERLAPHLGTRAPALRAALPVAALRAATEAEEPPGDAFGIGRALLTGIGAPRNIGHGLRLLAPLARAGDTRASQLIAEALAETRPSDAYGHALRAAADNRPGALALLDRIERGLPYEQAIAAQNALMSGPDDLYGDLDAMRAAARDFLTGTGRPRSWRAAYYWASMTAAAGDGAGAALRDEIDERMRLRGDAAAWSAEAESLENGVLRDWIARDVPGRLR